MTDYGFGRCMWAMDDRDPNYRIADGLQPLIQDVYHLLITERGTLWVPRVNRDESPKAEEFGFGLQTLILRGLTSEELPAIQDQIESALADDDRIASATVTITATGSEAIVNVQVQAANGASFRLVGPLSKIKVEILGASNG